MNVAALCSFPFGVVRWRAPEPTLTAIVKVTLTLDNNGRAFLAKKQDPLSLDRPPSAPYEELAYATDFAPRKARADIFLIGHARSAVPVTSIAASFAVGDMKKRFVAVADEPSQSIPLVGAHLRDGASTDAKPCGVGPRNWFKACAGSPEAALISSEGPPVGALSERFAFQVFNAAPADQQVSVLAPDASIVLEGLLPGLPRFEARLPGIEPTVFFIKRNGVQGEMALACDTLYVDTNRAACILVFRGAMPVPDLADDAAELVVVMRSPQMRPTWASVRGLRGLTACARAVEAYDLAQGAPPALPGREETAPLKGQSPAPVEPAVPADYDSDAITMPITLPPAKISPRPLPPAPARGAEDTTNVAGSDRQTEAPALPFRQASPGALSPAAIASPVRPVMRDGDTADEGSGTVGWAKPRSAPLPFRSPAQASSWPDEQTVDIAEIPPEARLLPFGQGAPPTDLARAESGHPPPRVLARGSIEADRDTGETSLPGVERAAALPFRPVVAPETRLSDSPAPEPPPAPQAVSPEPLAAPPAGPIGSDGPAPKEALPREPKSISLEVFVAIHAELWEGRARLGEILARHGVEEDDWAAHERRQNEALAEEARLGRCELALEIGKALRLARERLGGKEALRPLDEYARVRAAVEDAKDPSDALRGFGLSPAEWQSLHRKWQMRAASDPKVAEELSKALGASRKALALRSAAKGAAGRPSRKR